MCLFIAVVIKMRVALRFLSLCMFLFVLSGCSVLDAARYHVSQEGAQAMDRVLMDAEWVICKGVSVGAIRRRYAGTLKFQHWRGMCGLGPEGVP